MQQISIILADSQYLIRLGLKHLLVDHNDFNVVAEVTNEGDLLQELVKHRPNVVILDHDQPSKFNHETILI